MILHARVRFFLSVLLSSALWACDTGDVPISDHADANESTDVMSDAAVQTDAPDVASDVIVSVDAPEDSDVARHDDATPDATPDATNGDVIVDVNDAPDTVDAGPTELEIPSPAPGASPSACAPHFAPCDGVCRAVEVDPAHCGGCDVACDEAEECSGGACEVPAVRAPDCSDEVLAEVLGEATASAPWIALDCSVTLPPDTVVTKAIRLTGTAASGVVLDCQGGTVVRGHEEGGADVIVVESRRSGDTWERPTDVTIRNCRVEGSIRIRGQGNNGQAPAVTEDSWSLGHRERAQAAAPTRVTFENLTIVGDGRIPLYVAPGVTEFTFRESEIVGESTSTLVYLGAESAYNRLVGNRFAGDPHPFHSREVLAVDGAADNLIAGNTFENVRTGGIYIYRNCGEGGAVRHQEPRRNIIADNTIALDADRWSNPWLWVGSRNERSELEIGYCDDDSAYDFGSGADDSDYARDTIVVGNRIVDAPDRPDPSGKWGLTIEDAPTYVDDNWYVPALAPAEGAPCVVFGDESVPQIVADGATAADGRTCTNGAWW